MQVAVPLSRNHDAGHNANLTIVQGYEEVYQQKVQYLCNEGLRCATCAKRHAVRRVVHFFQRRRVVNLHVVSVYRSQHQLILAPTIHAASNFGRIGLWSRL